MKILDAILKAMTGSEKNHNERKEDVIFGALFHRPTPQKHSGSRHRPFTKPPMTGESKARRKMAARSRKINRGK